MANMVENIRKSNLETESEPVAFFRLKTERENEGGDSLIGSICFIARHPGAASYLVPVAKLLSQQEIDVYFTATQKAKERFELAFGAQLDVLTEVPRVKWAMLANDVQPDFEIENLKELKKLNPDLHIAVGEEVPGCLFGMLDALLCVGEGKESLAPDIVFTTTGEQRAEYSLAFPEISTKLVTVGQPSFDYLGKFNENERPATRRKMIELSKIESWQNLKIVVFAGVPRGDYPDIRVDGLPSEYMDLNSHALYLALESVRELSHQDPKTHYLFVYKPHPREVASIKHHPYLKAFEIEAREEGDTNLHFLFEEDEVWKELDLNTSKLCVAADLVLTTTSTIGQEVAVAVAKGSVKELSKPVLILPEAYFAAYRAMEEGKDSRIHISTDDMLTGPKALDAANATFVLSGSQPRPDLLAQAFDDSGKADGQSTLVDSYRLHSAMPAAKRVHLWLQRSQRLIDRSSKDEKAQ